MNKILTQNETELGRYYRSPEGNYPSVNTVLRHTRTAKEQKPLDKWRENNSPEQQQAVRESRGTWLHAKIEEFFRTQNLDNPETFPVFAEQRTEDYWRGISNTLRTHTTSTYKLPNGNLAIEQPVVHHELGYAGTYDWLGEWNGKLTLIDFKTTNSLKRLGWIKETRLQVAAYKLAVEAMLDIEILQTAVIYFVANKNTQAFYFREEDLAADIVGWQGRLKKYHKKYSKLNLIQT